MPTAALSRAAAWRALGAILISGLAALALGAPSSALARDWPSPIGHLSDFAGIVDAASRDSIDALCRELEEKTGAEIAVVTLADLGGETIDPVATDLFQAWGIGKKGKDDGVLILLAMQERRVRIEPGYGLEGILPDGLCGEIVRRVMGPELAAGKIGPGLLRGAGAVAGVIARDRGVTLVSGADLPFLGEEGSSPPGGFALFFVGFVVVLVLLLYMRLALGWVTGGDWRSRGRGGPGSWGGFGGFGGIGGFGGGVGGGRVGGGGGFGGFGGGRSGGGGASGGF